MKTPSNAITVIAVIALSLYSVSLYMFLQNASKKEKIFEAVKWLNNRREDQAGYFTAITDLCGDLCDLDKEIEQGDFMGSVKAKVDCDALFAIDLPEKPLGTKPPNWNQTVQIFQDSLSHNGRVDIKEWFWDNSNKGGAKMLPTHFGKKLVEKYIKDFEGGTEKHGGYAGASKLVNESAEIVNVTGKTVLVIGSQTPWLEAVLFSRKAAKVVTLEYGWFISGYPNLEFIRPAEFRQRYIAGTLDKFDAIFTYSSVEHSGLGRYGESLNPWADMITIAQVWCVSKPNAKLAIGVPTNVNGRDRIEFNAGRVYGPILYPYMVTNWKFIWPMEDKQRINPTGSIHYQPVFIFAKE